MKVSIVLALCVAAVCAREVQYGFPSFQYDKVTGRVVGGKDAPVGAAPYIVSLQLLGSHTCGGSIISETYVLTAAHCIDSFLSSLIKIIAGLHNLDQTSGSQSRSVSKLIKHQKYSGGVGPYDIGLIRVNAPFVFDERVKRIALPNPGEIHSGLVELFGWGSTSNTNTASMPKTLKTVEKPIVKYEECRDYLEDEAPLADSNICTGPLDAPISACSGDSGGPLVQNGEVIGIVSWGYMPCGIPEMPSVYTRTSAYIDWIQQNM